MQEYGTVISTLEGPSTRKFSFVIKKDIVVRRGQFVQLDVESGKLIGRIADIRKTNRYFINPESVKNVESDSSMLDSYPTWEWEYLVADVNAVGIYTDRGFQDPSFPPSPGVKVIEPETGILEQFFGLDKSGLHLGFLSKHTMHARINMTKLLQKHLAILAISGAGKSYLVGVLIEELLKRKAEHGNLSVVVIDPHGEYISFQNDPKYAGITQIVKSSEIRIGLRNVISPYSISPVLPVSDAQSRKLLKVVRKLKKQYSISDLITAIETSDDINQPTKDVLVSNIENIGRMGIFGVSDSPKIEELAKRGVLTVVDLSDTINMKKKQIITEHIARKLFHSRRHEKIPPFLLILEEAHQFVPEGAKREEALAKGILQTIAREGRKFHASLCLISQRPKHLSTTILSQCNSNIILRVTNPYDLDHIGASSEGITKDVQDQISTLPVGTGLIVGEAVNFPLFVKIRNRESKESEKGKPMEQACIEFYQKEKQEKKDAKAFM